MAKENLLRWELQWNDRFGLGGVVAVLRGKGCGLKRVAMWGGKVPSATEVAPFKYTTFRHALNRDAPLSCQKATTDATPTEEADPPPSAKDDNKKTNATADSLLEATTRKAKATADPFGEGTTRKTKATTEAGPPSLGKDDNKKTNATAEFFGDDNRPLEMTVCWC